MDYQYNDYELIYMIKESSEEALKIIIDKYDPKETVLTVIDLLLETF